MKDSFKAYAISHQCWDSGHLIFNYRRLNRSAIGINSCFPFHHSARLIMAHGGPDYIMQIVKVCFL